MLNYGWTLLFFILMSTLPSSTEVPAELVWPAAMLALVHRWSNTWHSWHLHPCWVDTCLSMLLVFAPLHDITALHWLHKAEFSSCLVKCSQALDRFLISVMLPRSWKSESLQRAWCKCTATQNFRKTGAGREMRESLRRIDKVGHVQFWWNWSAGTGSESELVLNIHPYIWPQSAEHIASCKTTTLLKVRSNSTKRARLFATTFITLC